MARIPKGQADRCCPYRHDWTAGAAGRRATATACCWDSGDCLPTWRRVPVAQSLSPGFRGEARVVRSGLCGSIQQFKGAFDAMMPSYRVVRGAGGQVGALVGLPADMAVVGDRPTTRTPPGRPWAHHASPACLARTTGSRSTCAGPGHGRPGCSTAKTPASHTEKYRFSATSYTPAGLIRNGCPSGTPRSSNPSPRSANRELNSRARQPVIDMTLDDSPWTAQQRITEVGRLPRRGRPVGRRPCRPTEPQRPRSSAVTA